MKVLKLSEIAAACKGLYNTETEISSVAIDTRKVEQGCLFICIIGENHDAHKFVGDAFKAGAAAVMISENIGVDGPYVRVEDTSKAMMDLAEYYRNMFKIPVVGITGSVGKTTAKEFTALALSAKYKTEKTKGNLNNNIGLPQTIFSITGETQAAVVEMGMNHFGEISNLSKTLRPNVGVITNIGVSHIENLGSQEGILKAKLEILDGMPKGSPLVLNYDDELLKKVKVDGHKIYSFSVNSPSDFRAVNIKEQGYNTLFDVVFNGEKYGVVIPTVGIHNVYNALSAIAVAVILNVDIKSAANELIKYEPVGMRQRIKKVAGITVIEDCYNASPDSMAAALKTLSTAGTGKKIAVLGDMLELGQHSKKAHSDVGATAAAEKIDYLLVMGENSKYMVSSAKKAGLKNAYYFDNAIDLENFLFETTKEGDSVLFKASRKLKFEDILESMYKRWM